MTDQGIVYILDGAGGTGFTPFVLRRTLAQLPYELVHFRWGKGWGLVLPDLTDRNNVAARAVELRNLISDYRDKNRGARIFIVAKSTGAVVALRALSELAPETVERAILLAPAISPAFPLSAALQAVQKEIVSFWSPFDLFFLGLGPCLFGTADGALGAAAGLTGFSVPEGLADEYAKLRQIKWQPAMIKSFNFGGHFGNTMPLFVREYILPWLV